MASSTRESLFFVKRLRTFSKRNHIRWDEWDEGGLIDVANVIVKLFQMEEGADNVIKAFELLVEWNRLFQCEKFIILKFLTGVQESIFCEDYDVSEKPKIWQIDDRQIETIEMIETRRIMQDESFAHQLSAEMQLNEPEICNERHTFDWQPVSPKKQSNIKKPSYLFDDADKVSHLSTLFPHVPDVELQSILHACNNDLDDAANHIYEKNAKSTESATFNSFCSQLDKIEQMTITPKTQPKALDPIAKPAKKSNRKNRKQILI